MKFKVILLALLLAVNLRHDFVEATTTKIVCQDDSFNLTVLIDFNVGVKNTFYYYIEESDSLVLENNVTFNQYAQECLDSVKFVFKIDGNFEFSREIKIEDHADFSHFETVFDNLLGLTKYTVDIGLNQKNSNQTETIYLVKGYEINTCFDAPSQPRFVATELNSNGSLTVSWHQPAKINAPKLCFYAVGENSVLVSKQTELAYLIPEKELTRVRSITVKAVNSKTCYPKEEYPYIEKCRSNELSSDNVKIEYKPYLPTPTSAPGKSTKTTFNSSNMEKFNFILSLFSNFFLLALFF